MIRDINISAKSAGDDTYYEPPAYTLNLAVIGGDAHLVIYQNDQAGLTGEPVASIEVPARSLHLALTAAIDDDTRPRLSDDNGRPAASTS